MTDEYDECEICADQGLLAVHAAYQGKTVFGPWANMCSVCAALYGEGTLTKLEDIKCFHNIN